jgi:hypothetical protein
MNYLKNYNLSDEDIKDITMSIDEQDKIEYDVHEENMKEILNYMYERSLNIKELLKNKSYIFYTDSKVLINKLENISDDELLKINDDIDFIDELI